MATIKQKLIELLKGMDVPERRFEDINWLNRNIGIMNAAHPNYELVMTLIQRILTKGGIDDNMNTYEELENEVVKRILNVKENGNIQLWFMCCLENNYVTYEVCNKNIRNYFRDLEVACEYFDSL